MKVLVYSIAGHGFQEACQYEAALEQSFYGNEVLFLYCDGSLGLCGENQRASCLRCKLCAHSFKKRIKNNLNTTIRSVPLGDYITKEIEEEVDNISFTYQNNEDLKKLFFHGVDIGYGALSSYISWTRNLNPHFHGVVKEYFGVMLRTEALLTLIIEKVLSEFPADLIIFHNGRYFFYKPVYRLAEIRNIPFICTETTHDIDLKVYREFIDNNVPHSVDTWTNNINRYWDNDTDVVNRKKIGEMFFYNRRHAKYSGDTIYSKDQIDGKLPADFNKSKENIVIFNSSEDELGAIGQEVEKYALFKSQYDAIVAIAERYKDDKTKHFYLRVHPNLKDLPYNYHVNLYKLNYPNLTVIPGNSDISSYALMDVADKVIVFGSTMGVESAFWKKPVICMSFAFYYNLGCVYTPKSREEAWRLIETKDLPILNYEAALKYGYRILTPKKEKFRFLNMDGSTFIFKGRIRRYSSVNKFLGSTKMSFVLSQISNILFEKMPFWGRFSNIPV